MAPHKIHQHKDVFRVLVKAKPSLRKAILKETDKKLVHAFCEICDNTLIGNIPLTPSQKTKLGKFKTILRKLARRGEGWKQKKKVLVQHGGGAFIPILISILSSVLPAILSGT